MNDGFFLTLQPHWSSQALNSTFEAFTHVSGCDGLARMNPVQLEILAIHAGKPGTGQFRTFIDSAKARFTTIIFMEVRNRQLAGMLFRYGFRPGTGYEFDGAETEIWLWKPNLPKTKPAI